MKPFPSVQAVCAAAAVVVFPLLASAHPGHDHSNIPSVIRHPLAGLDHAIIVAALAFGVVGTWWVLGMVRRPSLRHGARARTVRGR